MAAAFVRGLSGFGMAILLVPALALTISPESAVVSVNILGVLVGLVGIRKIWTISEGSVKPIAVLAMAATPLGLWLLQITDPGSARLLIAMIAVGAFILVLLPKRPAAHIPNRAETGLTGIASGILTGFAGMPGPPVIPYYLRRAIDPQVARASMMVIFLFTSIAGCIAAMAMGMMTRQEPLLAGLLFPAVLLGNWLGSLAFGRIAEWVWRVLTGMILGAATAAAVWKAVV
ncbi:sulfite exporter TauE/SafE family protein [Pontixanthobacter gangjinensis]|uniref:sulfite exporter TauE/SafE family protein n=1 Tax=Pontixanthobacter gangjinensis TaxID=1028742 RepID=UPI002E26E3C0